jgi:hypothetical protein
MLVNLSTLSSDTTGGYRAHWRITVFGYAMVALVLTTPALTAATSQGDSYYTDYKNSAAAEEHCNGPDMVQAHYDIHLRFLGYTCQRGHHRHTPQ